MSRLGKFLSYLGFIGETKEEEQVDVKPDCFIEVKQNIIKEVSVPAINTTKDKTAHKIIEDADDKKRASYLGNIIDGYDKTHSRKLLSKREEEITSRMPIRTPIHQCKRPKTIREEEIKDKVKGWAMAGYGK